MQNKAQRGLGRGLEALFRDMPEKAGKSTGGQVMSVPLEALVPNARQPRTFFEEAKLEELTESIRNQGIIQPIVVRPLNLGQEQEQKYEIVAGERRWRASQRAGLREVPVIVRACTEEQALLVALVENLQREDLNPLEEAKGLAELGRRFSLTQEDIAAQVGKSRSMVANTLRLLQLPEALQRDLEEKRLTPGQARPLLAVQNPEALLELRERILAREATARTVESWVAHWKKYGTLPEEGAESKRASKARAAGPSHSDIEALQKELARSLALKVRCTGNAEKGVIRLQYQSAAELATLMERLGIPVAEAASPAPEPDQSMDDANPIF